MTNIHEAKARLSEFLEAAARGERVLICRRNRPVAELRAVESVRTEPRPTAPALPGFVVPETFFEPLPDDVLEGFGAPDREVPAASRAAEDQARYSPSRQRRPRRR